MENLKQIKWMPLKGSAYPFIVGYGLPAWTSVIAKRYPDNIIMNILAMHMGENASNGIFAVEIDQYEISAKKLLSNLPKLQEFFDDFVIDELNFYKTVDKLLCDKAHITKNFNEFIVAYNAFYSSGGTVDGFLAYSENFVSQIKQKYPKNHKEIEILISPYGLNFIQKEHLSLIDLVLDIKEKNLSSEEINTRLAEHQEKFHWIQNNYKNTKGLAISYFEKEMKTLAESTVPNLKKEKDNIEFYESSHTEECRRVEESRMFSQEDYEKLLWIGKIAWWVDRRKACNLLGNYVIDLYAEAIAKENNFKYEDILFLFPTELDRILKREANIEDFLIKERRKSLGATYSKEDVLQIYLGQEAEELKNIIDPDITEKISEIRGTVASKGNTKGIARIIFDPNAEYTFNHGDILVTGMTRPDFVPLMKKASAIVTDEGGVTCHAAIISRELKKPCIIGTKIATKVLKDGDMVEVDADKGVVRILS